MPLEFLRDAGLIFFGVGAALFFGLSKAHSQLPELKRLDPLWIRTIGDGMMLGGAFLALMAMFGQWVLRAA
jgi:hypothetical protein